MRTVWTLFLLQTVLSQGEPCQGTHGINPSDCRISGKAIDFGGSNWRSWGSLLSYSEQIQPAVIPCAYETGSRTVRFSATGTEGYRFDRVFKAFLGLGVQCNDQWVESLDAGKMNQLVDLCEATVEAPKCSRENIQFSDLRQTNQCICVILYCTSEANWSHNCKATVNVDFFDPAATVLMPYVIYGFVWYDLLFFIYCFIMVSSFICITIGCLIRWKNYWSLIELSDLDVE